MDLMTRTKGLVAGDRVVMCGQWASGLGLGTVITVEGSQCQVVWNPGRLVPSIHECWITRWVPPEGEIDDAVSELVDIATRCCS